MTMPTRWQIGKIHSGIKETVRLIVKEEKYSKDLQKVEYLSELYSHLRRLERMLETGDGLPTTVAR